MMTRKWMSNDGDFTQLQSHIDNLQEHCAFMRPVKAQVRRRRRSREIRSAADFQKGEAT